MQKLQDNEWLSLFEKYEKFDVTVKDFYKRMALIVKPFI